MDLPFDIVVSAACPPKTAYLLDPALIETFPVVGENVLTGDLLRAIQVAKKKQLIVHSEEEAEALRTLGEAALRSLRIVGLA